MQNKPNLLDAQMNASSVITKYYENVRFSKLRQNKPNQSQYKANQSQYKPNSRKAKMNVTSILTKDYERNDIFAVPENKANSNPIKPNLETTPGPPDRVSSIHSPLTNHQTKSVKSAVKKYFFDSCIYQLDVVLRKSSSAAWLGTFNWKVSEQAER